MKSSSHTHTHTHTNLRCDSADVVVIGLEEMEMGTGSVALDAAKNMIWRGELVRAPDWRQSVSLKHLIYSHRRGVHA